jgi:hypothetical protein
MCLANRGYRNFQSADKNFGDHLFEELDRAAVEAASYQARQRAYFFWKA